MTLSVTGHAASFAARAHARHFLDEIISDLHDHKHRGGNETRKEVVDGHYLPREITDRTFFDGGCTEGNVLVRKEWRSLSHEEKVAFIEAQKCMMAMPNSTDNPGALDRFSDFQASHQQGTNQTDGDVIHYTVCILWYARWRLVN